MKTTKQEATGLLLVTLVMVYWGFTTVLMKHALHYMSPTTYIMLRFLIAGILVALFYAKRLRKAATPSLLFHGCILGLMELIPMEASIIALQYTTAANSVFISQLSFVFVPLIQCILLRKVPSRTLLLTMISLLLGLAIFADVAGGGFSAGSLFSVITALFHAINILCVKHFSATDDPALLGVLQVIFCALFSVPVWLIYPGSIQWCTGSVSILFFTGVIGSAVAFVASIAGQARTVPIKVSFLGLLQPIFAMIGGAVIADEFGNMECITPNMLSGAAIILITLAIYLKQTRQEEAA